MNDEPPSWLTFRWAEMVKAIIWLRNATKKDEIIIVYGAVKTMPLLNPFYCIFIAVNPKNKGHKMRASTNHLPENRLSVFVLFLTVLYICRMIFQPSSHVK